VLLLGVAEAGAAIAEELNLGWISDGPGKCGGGRPVGVVPFAEAEHTCVIACSREAKLRGVKNVMTIAEARERCPDIILVPQSPDLYRRAHNALISEISAVIPVDAVKSIDELTCRVALADRDDPQVQGRRIKPRRRNVSARARGECSKKGTATVTAYMP